MRICIIGGGNVGTAIAADLAREGKNEVVMLTGRPQKWEYEIESVDHTQDICFKSRLTLVTDNPELAMERAEVVIITTPSFLMQEKIEEIAPYVQENTLVGVMPGTGGFEYMCGDLLKKGIVVFGFDRVVPISRVIEYGRKVSAVKKKRVRLAAIPQRETERVAKLMSQLFEMEVLPLKNYLTVTFTPSNPILHTSRCYSMFKDYEQGKYWDRMIMFYEEWDDASSTILLGCDDELKMICDALDKMDMSGVIHLKEHYESETLSQVTNKIKTIPSHQGLTSPMKKEENGYVPDFSSRYFIEDIPFGLCILKGFAVICKVDTPYMDRILMWYQKQTGKEYLVDGKLEGKDIAFCAIPQNYGIHTVEDIYGFYL